MLLKLRFGRMKNESIKYVLCNGWFYFNHVWRVVFNFALGRMGKQREGQQMRRKKEQALKKIIKDDITPCKHCGNTSFNWDFILMIKTCKNEKCKNVSGVM